MRLFRKNEIGYVQFLEISYLSNLIIAFLPIKKSYKALKQI